MAKEKKISMQKIADQLGVSKVTVSKALNNKDGVSNELKSKIYDIAETNGYTLPSYGQRKTIKVAIIMSGRFSFVSNTGEFYMGMYKHIVAELRKVSCLTIMLTPKAETVDEDIETITTQESVDGMILLGILDKGVRDKIEKISLPKVYVDIYDRSHKSDSVVTENIYSTYELTEYLLTLGFREIGFVGTIGATTSITDRYLGYQRAILEKSITLRDDWIIPDRDMDGEPMKLTLPSEMPKAFVCNCDETAYRLIQALKEKEINVPKDVSIVGFDNDIYAKLSEPKLTTVAVNTEKIGKVTARRMVESIKNPDKKAGEVYRIPGKNIFRDSVEKKGS